MSQFPKGIITFPNNLAEFLGRKFKEIEKSQFPKGIIALSNYFTPQDGANVSTDRVAIPEGNYHFSQLTGDKCEASGYRSGAHVAIPEGNYHFSQP